MKLNHRLLITSGLLLAMSTVAMSTATYAWFTTTRQSQVQLTNITIQQDSNLEMQILSVNGVSTPESTTGVKYGTAKDFGVYSDTDTIFTGNAVQDVSGDGVNFFKPNIASDEETFTSVTAVNDSTIRNYVNEIVLGFRSDKAYQVFLNEGTALTEADTQAPTQGAPTDNHLNDCARVAFFDRGAQNAAELSTSNLRGVLVNTVETGPKHSFITSAAEGTRPTSVNLFGDGGNYNQGYSGFEALSPAVRVNATSDIATKTAPGVGLSWYVTQLSTVVNGETSSGFDEYRGPNGTMIPAYKGYITVRIWVEGTDEQCTGNAKYGKFSVTLNFNSYLPA